jgi:hypothetical protein
MSDRPPDLHMLNLVVGDMSASLDFFRRLGGSGDFCVVPLLTVGNLHPE